MEAVKEWGKRLLGRNFILPLVSDRRYVFLFHDVSEPSARHHNSDASIGVWPYSYTPDAFVSLVELFTSLFELVSLDAIVSERPGRQGRNFGTIAFDDGFESVVTDALPVLRAKGIPFSVFVNKQAVIQNRLTSSTEVMLRKAVAAGEGAVLHELYTRCDEPAKPAFDAFAADPFRYVDERLFVDDAGFFERAGFAGRRVYLDASGVQQLARQGVTIGSHTVSHSMLSDCDEPTLRYEIGENKRYLSDLVGGDILHFAIPFGGKSTFTDLALEVCREMGHTYIYSTSPTSFRYRDVAGGRTVVPRYCIYKPVPREFLFYINRPFFLPSEQ